MKIKQLIATPLALTHKVPYHYSLGAPRGGNCILIEIETDQGITGVGEVTAGQNVEALRAILAASDPVLVGDSPFDIERIVNRFTRYHKMTQMPSYAANIVCGIEMALWDIIGKAVGQPVHRLLGGKLHESIEFFGFVQGRAPQDMADHAVQLRDDGFRILYYKLGYGLDEDLVITERMRAALGEKPLLRGDPNEAYTIADAKHLSRNLAPYAIDWLEQPLPAADLDGMAQLRAASDIPIAVDQSVQTLHDAMRAVRAGAGDAYVTGFHECGGLLALKKVAACLQAANLNFVRKGMVGETGVSTLAALQILATIPNGTPGHQVMHQLLAEDIVPAHLLKFDGGAIAVPDRPGLGIELDRDRVDQLARRYRDQGQYGMNIDGA